MLKMKEFIKAYTLKGPINKALKFYKTLKQRRFIIRFSDLPSVIEDNRLLFII